MIHSLLAVLAICTLLLTAGVEAREESAAGESKEELVERILELQRRIDELMARLPPEVREELRRRLAEGAVTPAPARAEPPEAIADVETSAIETPAVEAPTAEPVVAPPPAAPALPSPRRRPRRAPCNTLQPLDENADGQISSADRYWRYLYLWTDKDGDGQMQEREIHSPYEHRVREIGLSLETFSRVKGSLGEIRLEDRVVFDLRGDGFSERARRDDGVLLVDATALKRGDGPELLGPEGETLDGLEPFRAGLSIKAGGEVTALDCPRARSDGD